MPMIAARAETLVSLTRAAAILGEPLPAVIRWTRTGLNGTRLETTHNHSGVSTSVEAIGRFLVKVGVKSLHQ